VPSIAAVTTAVPPHVLTQDQARAFAEKHFRARRDDIARLLPAFDHAGIATRYVVVEPEWFDTEHDFAEQNAQYIDWSIRLGTDVVASCLRQAGLEPSEITHIVFVSTTGLATPSIDARLVNRCALSSHVARTPVWGLGCAGGAAGLSLAYRLALSDPGAKVLLVVVELCSLTFHPNDFSRSNVIATALFGDGAAGAVVVGDRVTSPHGSPRILDTQSTTWPDSLDVMGWNFDAFGMQVVFSRAIPQIVRARVRENVAEFLKRSTLSLADLSALIAHPGGAKVIAAYQEALALPDAMFEHPRAVLRDYGNMSAASALFVLKRVIDGGAIPAGGHALLTALGPGFSSENVLLRF